MLRVAAVVIVSACFMSACSESFSAVDFSARSGKDGAFLVRSANDIGKLIGASLDSRKAKPGNVQFVPAGTPLLPLEERYLVNGEVVKPFFATPSERSRRAIWIVWRVQEVGTVGQGWVLERDLTHFNLAVSGALFEKP